MGAKLQFSLVTQNVEKTSFDCGNQTINGYIKDSYYATLIQEAYGYRISAEELTLGYFQILFRELKMEDFPETISDYQASIKTDTISALHIRYLAIDKKYQKKGIGTAVIKIILQDICDLSKKFPVRVVTIDAVIERVEWYKKLGFKELQKNTVSQDGITQAMFFDCCTFLDKLNEYIDQNCENM